MSLESVLDIVKERGLRIYLDRKGGPRLQGPKHEQTPALLDALKAYRGDIIARLQPLPVRRVVLLMEGRDSPIEKELEVITDGGHEGRVRHWAERYPGRTVAAETWELNHADKGWQRYFWMVWPESGNSQTKEGQADDAHEP
jgi:hypothetical protein